MDHLEGALRHYDWGSTSFIPELLGRPATSDPVAEWWLGAHPVAPARVGPSAVPLDELIAADPVAALGADVASRFGELPFLFKVLAAEAPLSLQAHPSSAQAAAGFAREEAAGVPLDAPDRSFPDPNHKPELICALTSFDALCGFRAPAATLELLDGLGLPALDHVRDALAAAPSADGLRHVVAWMLRLAPEPAAALVHQVAVACAEPGPFPAERAMVVELAGRHPADPGVVVALLLNLVRLEPGDGLFLGAGHLHAYLRGAGVELMANSDNVLRGGLTTKHVDVDTLLDIVDTTPTDPPVQRPAVVDGVAAYRSGAPEFALHRLEVDSEASLPAGPAVAIATAGRITAGPHVLERGSAMWIPATDGVVGVEGRGTLFVATVGRPGD